MRIVGVAALDGKLKLPAGIAHNICGYCRQSESAFHNGDALRWPRRVPPRIQCRIQCGAGFVVDALYCRPTDKIAVQARPAESATAASPVTRAATRAPLSIANAISEYSARVLLALRLLQSIDHGDV